VQAGAANDDCPGGLEPGHHGRRSGGRVPVERGTGGRGATGVVDDVLERDRDPGEWPGIGARSHGGVDARGAAQGAVVARGEGVVGIGSDPAEGERCLGTG